MTHLPYVRCSATAWKERRPDINPDFLGVYPWDWVRDDIANFKAISGGLLVAPILQTLILNRSPVETLDFADQVAKWPIERIIPGHLKVVCSVLFCIEPLLDYLVSQFTMSSR